MVPQSAGSNSAEASRLPLVWLAHLQQEEALLAETVESLRQIRAALREGALDALKAALDRQARIANASVELRERRTSLRREVSTVLGLSARDVTLTSLAEYLPREVAAHMLACRDRLTGMAAEVDRLNSANAALVGQSLEFLERFLLEMTAGNQAGCRYSGNGTACEPLMGSLIEARG